MKKPTQDSGRRRFLKTVGTTGLAALGTAGLSGPALAAVQEGAQWSEFEETVYEYGGIDTNDVLYGHDFQLNYLEKNYSSANSAFYLTFEMFGTGYKRQRSHGSTDDWQQYNSDIVHSTGFTVSTSDSGVGIYHTPNQEEQTSAAAIPKEDAYTTNEVLADVALSIATRGVSKMVDRKVLVYKASDMVESFVGEYTDNSSSSQLDKAWTNDDVYDMLSPRQRHTLDSYVKFRVEVPDSYGGVNLSFDSWSQATSSSSSRQNVPLDIYVDLDNSSGGGVT